jgi:hypothetical protein
MEHTKYQRNIGEIVNKQVLGTILGAALLGLAKSKGSSARKTSLDDFFKKKVGNQDQTFKISFYTNYTPLWADYGSSGGEVIADFSDEIHEYVDFISDTVSGFQAYLEEVYHETPNNLGYFYRIEEVEAAQEQAENDGDAENWLDYIETEDIDDIFSSWCYDESIAFMDQDVISEFYTLSDLQSLYERIKNSKLVISTMTEDRSEYDITSANVEDLLSDAKSTVDMGNIFENMDDSEFWITKFAEELYARGELDGITWDNSDYVADSWDEDEYFLRLLPELSTHKEALKSLLDDLEWDLFGGEDLYIDWDWYTSIDGGYLDGYLEVKLNIDTFRFSLNDWKNYIENIIENAYSGWHHSKKSRDVYGDEAINSITILKVEPDIWAKKKSNLRKR